VLHRIEDAQDIDVEDLSVLFLGDFVQRGSSFDTGVVKGDIETTVGCQDEINSCPDIGILGEIGFEEGRGTTMQSRLIIRPGPVASGGQNRKRLPFSCTSL
jgi:hypothetical protein